jgi:hypothetical protein
MADLTYNPNDGPAPGMGYDITPRPRPIASPFGALPGLRAPTPPQQPGLNASPGTPAGWLPEWLAQLVPSGQVLKQDVAETLGAPVDMASWALMKLGMPIPRAPTLTPYSASDGSRGTWAPSASVPLGSQNIRGMLDNPPPLDAFLQAMRRYGRF